MRPSLSDTAAGRCPESAGWCWRAPQNPEADWPASSLSGREPRCPQPFRRGRPQERPAGTEGRRRRWLHRDAAAGGGYPVHLQSRRRPFQSRRALFRRVVVASDTPTRAHRARAGSPTAADLPMQRRQVRSRGRGTPARWPVSPAADRHRARRRSTATR